MLISIEGCIGAGKSTLTSGLAEFRNSKKLLEAFETNPFLEAFYKDSSGNAIETEFSFLLLHYHQLKNALVASNEEVISDFYLDKDVIFADLNLQDHHFRSLFDGLYALLLERLPKPDLLIFLSIPDDLMIQRIRRRQRSFELGLDASYFIKVNALYNSFFASYEGKKVDIQMNDWDFIERPQLFQKLSEMVDKHLPIK